MAETEGFEPPHACASDCLPDNSLQPDLACLRKPYCYATILKDKNSEFNDLIRKLNNIFT